MDKGSNRGAAKPSGSWASFIPGLPLIPNLPTLDPGVEQYRSLALKVESAFAQSKEAGNVVVVSAPDAGSGKTLTSLNLSIALAKKGERRILLLECDIWKPTIRSFLKMGPDLPSLIDLLAHEGNLDYRRAVVTIWSYNIDVITSDGRRPDADLLTGSGMRHLLAELRSNYDFVVCDAPPFFLAGGRFLVEIADKVLVVARARMTKRRAIESLLEDVPRDRCLGLVLNDLRGHRGRNYGYSYKDKYGGYAKYMEPRPDKKKRR